MARNEPTSKFYATIYEATADANIRRTSVWINRSAEEGKKLASATYDGLQDDLGWNGASGYEYIPRENRPIV